MCCLYIPEPAIFDYNKRLIQLTVIPLSGRHCILKNKRGFVVGQDNVRKALHISSPRATDEWSANTKRRKKNNCFGSSLEKAASTTSSPKCCGGLTSHTIQLRRWSIATNRVKKRKKKKKSPFSNEVLHSSCWSIGRKLVVKCNSGWSK